MGDYPPDLQLGEWNPLSPGYDAYGKHVTSYHRCLKIRSGIGLEVRTKQLRIADVAPRAIQAAETRTDRHTFKFFKIEQEIR